MTLPRTFRSLADWCIGPRMQEQLGAAWTRMAPGDAANRALAGRHAGMERCFIIGNGPSLKGVDLKPLAGEYTIGANSFYKHPDAEAIGLDYLCIFDPHFMSDEPRTVDWHRTIAQRLGKARFVLHASARALVARHGLYEGREVYYVRSGIPTRYSRIAHFDMSRRLNVGRTTGSSVAIPLAMYLGFKQICLIGFDCNWLESVGSSYHFYQTHEHFPEFDSVAADTRGYRYEDELQAALREFESHRLWREVAERNGVRIVNATNGGLLDTYERKPFEQVLAEVRPAKTPQAG